MRARDNPLATDRLESLSYRFQESSWSEFLLKLNASNNRGSIVGPEGSGKTTLLEELKPILEEKGFDVVVYGLKKERRRVPLHFWWKSLNKQIYVFLDGAEQLGGFEWWLFKLKTKLAAGLVITSHTEGLLPTLLKCETSIELFKNLLTELVGDCLSDKLIREAYMKKSGNIRLAFLYLYDVYARSETGKAPSYMVN